MSLIKLLLSLIVVKGPCDRRGQIVPSSVLRVFTPRPISFVIIELSLAELIEPRMMTLSVDLIHRILFIDKISASMFRGQRPLLLHNMIHTVLGICELCAINLQSFLLVVELLSLNSYIL